MPPRGKPTESKATIVTQSRITTTSHVYNNYTLCKQVVLNKSLVTSSIDNTQSRVNVKSIIYTMNCIPR